MPWSSPRRWPSPGSALFSRPDRRPGLDRQQLRRRQDRHQRREKGAHGQGRAAAAAAAGRQPDLSPLRLRWTRRLRGVQVQGPLRSRRPVLPTETPYLSPKEIEENIRLACQVKVKRDLKIRVPEEVLEIRKFEGTVRSNRNVATFIKELILDLPPGEAIPTSARVATSRSTARRTPSFHDFHRRGEVPRRLGPVQPVAVHPTTTHPSRRAPTPWPTTRRRGQSSCSTSASPPPPAGRRRAAGPCRRTSSRSSRATRWRSPAPSVSSSRPKPERDVLHRRRRGHGAHAVPHLRPVRARWRRTRDHLLVRRSLAREVFYVDDFEAIVRGRSRTSRGTSRCRSRAGGHLDRAHGVHPPGAASSSHLNHHPAPRTANSIFAGHR